MSAVADELFECVWPFLRLVLKELNLPKQMFRYSEIFRQFMDARLHVYLSCVLQTLFLPNPQSISNASKRNFWIFIVLPLTILVKQISLLTWFVENSASCLFPNQHIFQLTLFNFLPYLKVQLSIYLPRTIKSLILSSF